MTKTDQELYEMAKWLRLGLKSGSRFATLCDEILERFKPREPRIIEEWCRVHTAGLLHGTLWSQREIAEAEVRKFGGYLAHAVITEVME